MTESKAPFPFGFALVLVIVSGLYVAVLHDAVTIQTGGGEAVIAAAFEGLFLVVGLWLALTLLLIIGAVAGNMPCAAAYAAVPLVPASGVAAFVALDMCSRDQRWAAVFPAALAALLAFYACWARWPRLRAALPPPTMTRTVWGAVFVLSAAAFASAAIW